VVFESLRKLKIEHKYLNNRGKLVWKKLPKHQMLDVINLSLMNHPYERKFN
jgi:hypothetical protein